MGSFSTQIQHLKRRRYIWIQISLYIACLLVFHFLYSPKHIAVKVNEDGQRQLQFMEPGTCKGTELNAAELECGSSWTDPTSCENTKEYFWCLQNLAFSCYEMYINECNSNLTAACGSIPSCACQSSQLYPVDAFFRQPYCANRWSSSGKKAAVILHVIGMFYMFIGLSLVCDEYFCGALDVMVERWQMKPDVAGATLMAAGGSAPELFTSLLGVFFSESDVGFGTIVGSAVFNVLFVIGLCAVFAHSALQLTWWPLFRDCSFYLVSLTVLTLCAADKVIKWYEALVLFLMYILYVTLMKWNSQLEQFFEGLFFQSKVHTMDDEDSKKKYGLERVASGDLVIEMKEGALSDLIGEEDDKNKEVALHPKHVQQIVKRQVTQHWKTTGQVSVKKAQEAVYLRTQRRKQHITEFKAATNMLMMYHGNKIGMADSLASHVIKEENSKSLDDTSADSTASAASIHPFDEDLDYKLKVQPSKKLSEGDAEAGAGSAVAPSHKTSEAPINTKEQGGDGKEEEESDCNNLFEWPDSTHEQVVFMLVLPVSILLHYAIPNCTNKKYEDYFLATFVLSLFWIFIFSFLLVWWATIFGAVIGIPDVVMGLTLLAMGTSIPDAVSSVVMARIGEGDMAVSSSIGSNIFDILFGLPVPWLLYSVIVSPITTGKVASYSITSDYIAVYVLLLILMVFLVIGSIVYRKWQLDRSLGAIMAAFYIIFLAFALIIEFGQPSALMTSNW
mmetsp:Transcript_38903/g.50298  ORF Transcript_38903/g.50298 Transcript_38903/m.50298 type:complete len:731 (-) Transcript_38903:453-2645(-)